MSTINKENSVSMNSLKEGEVDLLFVKSKVYLHPTPAKKDNVCGFLTLSRGPSSTNKDIQISFVPELQLSKKDMAIYVKADIDDLRSDLELLKLGGAGPSSEKTARQTSIHRVSKPRVSVLSGYAVGAPLSFVYSIQVRLPKPGFWHGSIIVHTKDGEKFPVFFFHDNESASTKSAEKLRAQQFDPFGKDGNTSWGGSDFMRALEKFINVERSTFEPSMYIINPESGDLRNFAPRRLAGQENPSKSNTDFKLPEVGKEVGKFFNGAKWRILETVASFSARTKIQVKDLVEDHAPLTVKQMINNPEVQKIGNDFDSARVYLAKWAQQVKEEAEQSRGTSMLDDGLYSKINQELGSSECLTSEEISKASRRDAIGAMEWASFFDYSGRLSITVDEVKSRIFHGGLDPSVRGEAWLFLLQVYPWDSSREERQSLRQSYETAYSELKMKWVNDDEKRSQPFWQDQKHRIEKDVHRTDRGILIFNHNVTSEGANRDSSPETPDEEEDQDGADIDVSNITNPHLYKLREILLTFNEYNVNLGYVQGMNDLLSPLYFVIRDEALTFWAFSKFMERMERNFVRDQLGIKNQMVTLNKLVQFMLPTLYKHLEKCESVDLFFCFRMLLVWFKRELEWDQVLQLWEICWTDYYTSQYHLFFALSILSDNERIMIQNLERFDEVLKYTNDLSMKLKLEPLLVRSELLFLKFRRMIAIIDRKSNDSVGANKYSQTETYPVARELRALLSRDMVIQKEVARPEGAGGG